MLIEMLFQVISNLCKYVQPLNKVNDGQIKLTISDV